jgi:hypothetical protein
MKGDYERYTATYTDVIGEVRFKLFYSNLPLVVEETHGKIIWHVIQMSK